MPALHRKRGPMHEINVVPYVDVMLVLLVIFMVTAPLVTPGQIDLPSVASASPRRPAPVEIVSTADRKISLRERDKAGKVINESTIARGDIARLIKDPETPV